MIYFNKAVDYFKKPILILMTNTDNDLFFGCTPCRLLAFLQRFPPTSASQDKAEKHKLIGIENDACLQTSVSQFKAGLDLILPNKASQRLLLCSWCILAVNPIARSLCQLILSNKIAKYSNRASTDLILCIIRTEQHNSQQYIMSVQLEYPD